MPPKRFINTDPNINAPTDANIDRIRATRKNNENLVPWSPDWPPASENRPQYLFLAPPLAVSNDSAGTVRTCEVCGLQASSDGFYYEHMKGQHPWAPRSFNHGQYRAPVVDPNLTPQLQIAAYDERIESTRALADDMAFDMTNPDGPYHLTEIPITDTMRERCLFLWDITDGTGENAPPGTTPYVVPQKPAARKFRIGRIIAPTLKNGSPLTLNTRFRDTRRELAAEFMLPTEHFAAAPAPAPRGSDFVVGSFVLYLDDEAEPYPFFLNMAGTLMKHVPWRMIQPVVFPWGIPENVTLAGDGVGLPMLRSVPQLAAGTRVGSGRGPGLHSEVQEWDALDQELLLQLTPAENRDALGANALVRVTDYEMRRGNLAAGVLTETFEFPWGLRFQQEWLNTRKQGLDQELRAWTPEVYVDGAMPLRFRLGRIIHPTLKDGTSIADANTAGLIAAGMVMARGAWREGSLVLYLTENDADPNPRFRNIMGEERHIPHRMVQRLHLPFDLPEDLPRVEFGGEGLPILRVDQGNWFFPGAAVDNDSIPRSWKADEHELLFLSTSTPYATQTAFGDFAVMDYERRTGNYSAASGARVTWVHPYPWGVRVGAEYLAGRRVARVMPASSPTNSQPGSPTETPEERDARLAAEAETERVALLAAHDAAFAAGVPTPLTVPIVLITPQRFSALSQMVELVDSATAHPAIKRLAAEIRLRINERHSAVLTAKNLRVEPEDMADWRPTYWVEHYRLVLNAPRLTDTNSLRGLGELRAIVTELMGRARAAPRLPTPQLLTRFLLEQADIELTRLAANASGTNIKLRDACTSIAALARATAAKLEAANLTDENPVLALERVAQYKRKHAAAYNAIAADAATLNAAETDTFDRLTTFMDIAAGTVPFYSAKVRLNTADLYYASERLNELMGPFMSGTNAEFKAACLSVGAFARERYELLARTNQGIENEALVAQRAALWKTKNAAYEKVKDWTEPKDGITANTLIRLRAYATNFAGPLPAPPATVEPGCILTADFRRYADELRTFNTPSTEDSPARISALGHIEQVRIDCEEMFALLTRQTFTEETTVHAQARAAKYIQTLAFYQSALPSYQTQLVPTDLRNFNRLIEIATIFRDTIPPFGDSEEYQPPQDPPQRPPPTTYLGILASLFVETDPVKIAAAEAQKAADAATQKAIDDARINQEMRAERRRRRQAIQDKKKREDDKRAADIAAAARKAAEDAARRVRQPPPPVDPTTTTPPPTNADAILTLARYQEFVEALYQMSADNNPDLTEQLALYRGYCDQRVAELIRRQITQETQVMAKQRRVLMGASSAYLFDDARTVGASIVAAGTWASLRVVATVLSTDPAAAAAEAKRKRDAEDDGFVVRNAKRAKTAATEGCTTS
ncbi:uncharacterized protein LY89DRAFT_780346 [Mollisia scopiformis]|uniref:Uncharacterized protein n=1 Tax=Mollisia scopiformis TaxID=149040 RepID=A0A194XGS3_MOLSC|nr:uncharacterized protein LY89DRAFT_780346 [Mollisia scopiformis]KUJ19400.1 hypothetical protein LY89DRAFT_780346 [Mollisia scopiformis]